jgi:multidrug efflux system membrane fusion protein
MSFGSTRSLRPFVVLKRVALYAVPLAVFAVVVLLFIRMRMHRTLTDSDYARAHGAPLPVRVYRVDDAALNQSIPAECVARPNPLVLVRSNLPGRVVIKTHVRPGQLVKAGAPLVTMDSQPERLAVARAGDMIAAYQKVITANEDLLKYYQTVRDEGFGFEREVRLAGVEIAKAQTQLAQAEAELRDSKAGILNAQVSSPTAGAVTQIAQPGEAAVAGSALATVAAIDPILLECTLTEDKLAFVRAGLPFEATFYSWPGQAFQGTVREVDALAAEKDRTITMRGELANPNGVLLPGLHGIAQIRNEQRTLRVPSVALINPRSDLAEVFMIDAKDKAHLRQVKIGGAAGGYVQILSGLALGDRVVVAGQLGLRANDATRVTEDAPSGAAP